MQPHEGCIWKSERVEQAKSVFIRIHSTSLRTCLGFLWFQWSFSPGSKVTAFEW